MSRKRPDFGGADANASSAEHIDSEIHAVYASGVVPVEVFNRIESQRPMEETETKEPPGEPAFGTNIRDAARIVKEWQSSSHGEK